MILSITNPPGTQTSTRSPLIVRSPSAGRAQTTTKRVTVNKVRSSSAGRAQKTSKRVAVNSKGHHQQEGHKHKKMV